jgi:hypothetical protein
MVVQTIVPVKAFLVCWEVNLLCVRGEFNDYAKYRPELMLHVAHAAPPWEYPSILYRWKHKTLVRECKSRRPSFFYCTVNLPNQMTNSFLRSVIRQKTIKPF